MRACLREGHDAEKEKPRGPGGALGAGGKPVWGGTDFPGVTLREVSEPRAPLRAPIGGTGVSRESSRAI